MTLKEDIARALENLRSKAPLVHCITNYVTAGDTANFLLAAGASPIMADDPAESGKITDSADALLLNLGVPSCSKIDAMVISGAAASSRKIPVVFDPVGVGMSGFRKGAAKRILEEVHPTAVRGNLSEAAFLAGFASHENGVDSAESAVSAAEAAVTAARKLGCVCAVTGEHDVISDGQRTCVIRNGTAMLRKITGAGCMTSALCAAFCSVCGDFAGTAAGIAFMDICGEIALDCSSGAGSFRAALFDAAEGVTPEILLERLDIDEG